LLNLLLLVSDSLFPVLGKGRKKLGPFSLSKTPKGNEAQNLAHVNRVRKRRGILRGYRDRPFCW
jgi:hypothetical protein